MIKKMQDGIKKVLLLSPPLSQIKGLPALAFPVAVSLQIIASNFSEVAWM